MRMMSKDKIATIPVTEEGPANLHITYMYSLGPGNIRIEDAYLFCRWQNYTIET